MKIVNRGKHLEPVILAALVLGLFSLNPTARAAFLMPGESAAPPAPVALPAATTKIDPAAHNEDNFKNSQFDGTSLDTLNSISRDFALQVQDGNLMLYGAMPSGCMDDPAFSITEDYDPKRQKQYIKVNIPDVCQNLANSNIKKDDPGLELEPFSSKFPNGIKIKSTASGKIYIRSAKNGSLAKDEELPCKSDEGVDIGTCNYETPTDRQNREAKERAAAIADAQAKKQKRVLDDLTSSCESGDWDDFTSQLKSANLLSGDVSEILKKVGAVQKDTLAKALTKAVAGIDKADGIRNLKEAYTNYVTAAQDPKNHWPDSDTDIDDKSKQYIEARDQAISNLISSGEASAEKVADAIHSMESDLADVDSLKPKDLKIRVAFDYGKLAESLANKNDYNGAETYYNKAIAETPLLADKAKAELAMYNMFLAAAAQCVKDHPLAQEQCKALSDKASKHQGNAFTDAKNALNGKDDGTLSTLSMDHIRMFGSAAPAIQVGGFGDLSLNPQAAGQWENYKKTVFDSAYQSQVAQAQAQQAARMGVVNTSALLGVGANSSLLGGNSSLLGGTTPNFLGTSTLGATTSLGAPAVGTSALSGLFQ